MYAAARTVFELCTPTPRGIFYDRFEVFKRDVQDPKEIGRIETLMKPGFPLDSLIITQFLEWVGYERVSKFETFFTWTLSFYLTSLQKFDSLNERIKILNRLKTDVTVQAIRQEVLLKVLNGGKNHLPENLKRSHFELNGQEIRWIAEVFDLPEAEIKSLNSRESLFGTKRWRELPEETQNFSSHPS